VPFFLPAFSSKEKAEGALKKLIQFIFAQIFKHQHTKQ
jgi:hypothetical protein